MVAGGSLRDRLPEKLPETIRTYIDLPSLASALTSHMALLQLSFPQKSHRGPAKCKERGQKRHRLMRGVFENLQMFLHLCFILLHRRRIWKEVNILSLAPPSLHLSWEPWFQVTARCPTDSYIFSNAVTSPGHNQS